jgi:hypothetical protein
MKSNNITFSCFTIFSRTGANPLFTFRSYIYPLFSIKNYVFPLSAIELNYSIRCCHLCQLISFCMHGCNGNSRFGYMIQPIQKFWMCLHDSSYLKFKYDYIVSQTCNQVHSNSCLHCCPIQVQCYKRKTAKFYIISSQRHCLFKCNNQLALMAEMGWKIKFNGR